MNNNDVVTLTQLGLEDDIIIKKIDSSVPDFELTESSIINMLQSGVSYKVLRSIIYRQEGFILANSLEQEDTKLANNSNSQDDNIAKTVEKKPKQKHGHSIRLGLGNDYGALGMGLSINIVGNKIRPLTFDLNLGIRNYKNIKVADQKNWKNLHNWYSFYHFNPDYKKSKLQGTKNEMSYWVGSFGLTKHIGEIFTVGANFGVRDWVVRIPHEFIGYSNGFALYQPNYEDAKFKPILGFSLNIGLYAPINRTFALFMNGGYSKMTLVNSGNKQDVYYGGSEGLLLGYHWESLVQENFFFQGGFAIKL